MTAPGAPPDDQAGAPAPPALSLRPVGEADAPAVAGAVERSRPELERWMPWCHPGYGESDALAWIRASVEERRVGRGYAFGIFGAAGEFLGSCGLHMVDAQNRAAALGYWVRSDVTGRGIATAGARWVARHAFEVLGLELLEIRAAVRNAASQRVAERLGARLDAALPARLLLQGVRHDIVVYSLTPILLRDRPPSRLAHPRRPTPVGGQPTIVRRG
ncbi:MAG TPA: GNAT family N-acetyltransferase [Gemmatimonadaceae bacterium]|nr:GNAT family N-acetyltransferase [Gemmatimonadaceae bacterium]